MTDADVMDFVVVYQKWTPSKRSRYFSYQRLFIPVQVFLWVKLEELCFNLHARETRCPRPPGISFRLQVGKRQRPQGYSAALGSRRGVVVASPRLPFRYRPYYPNRFCL